MPFPALCEDFLRPIQQLGARAVLHPCGTARPRHRCGPPTVAPAEPPDRNRLRPRTVKRLNR
jgi:hypothetical protein